MRESHTEGVATHSGPEPCVGVREGAGEASVGVRAGWAIEPRNQRFVGADAVVVGGRQHRWPRYREWPADPRGRRTCACTESPRARTGRSRGRPSPPVLPCSSWGGGSAGSRAVRERRGGTPLMHDPGKSDSPVVPAKLPNNAGVPAAEAVEERGLPRENAASKPRPGRSAGQGAPSELDRVCQVAQGNKEARFTALLQHVLVDRLRAAYGALRPKAVAGVDGVTWEDYGRSLEANLQDLHERVHCGSYRAKPVRRAYIPKRDGRLRPLGIAALEDKIL
jgi:hypothetical protein